MTFVRPLLWGRRDFCEAVTLGQALLWWGRYFGAGVPFARPLLWGRRDFFQAVTLGQAKLS